MKFRPRYASNSGIFEKRGDPWVTQRDAKRDYNRNPETEDADRDFDHRYHSTGFGPKQAAPRPEHRGPKPAPREDDGERRKASIARRMNMRMNSRAPRVEIPAPAKHFLPCAGCKSARCISSGVCLVGKSC